MNSLFKSIEISIKSSAGEGKPALIPFSTYGNSSSIAVSAEYKIKVQKDGKIKVIYGPKVHSPEKVMKKLEKLGNLQMIKYLI